MTPTTIKTRGPFPFSHCVNAREPNPCAHGAVCYRDDRSDGASRLRNVNGGHEEAGPWDIRHTPAAA